MSSKGGSSAATKSKDERRRKKKKPLPTTEPVSILSLPDDLLLNCLACISRLYHPTLSLVCKTFRSIISSPEFYDTRSLLNRTESCLYLCLHYNGDPNTYWYTLCKRPNQNLTSKSTGNIFIPVPSPLYPKRNVTTKSHRHFFNPSLFACGSDIYEIGGDGSTSVYVMDCRTHKWHQAPSMREDRNISKESDNSSYCLIDNVLFMCDKGMFKCYDFEVSLWKVLEGLEGLPDLCQYRFVKILDLGGKMAVLWWFSGSDSIFPSRLSKHEVWCAEIALERRNGDEIWGKVEWLDITLTTDCRGKIEVFDNVVTFPSLPTLSSMDVLSATV